MVIMIVLRENAKYKLTMMSHFMLAFSLRIKIESIVDLELTRLIIKCRTRKCGKQVCENCLVHK